MRCSLEHFSYQGSCCKYHFDKVKVQVKLLGRRNRLDISHQLVIVQSHQGLVMESKIRQCNSNLDHTCLSSQSGLLRGNSSHQGRVCIHLLKLDWHYHRKYLLGISKGKLFLSCNNSLVGKFATMKNQWDNRILNHKQYKCLLQVQQRYWQGMLSHRDQ